MDVRFKLVKPDALEATVSITMKVADFRELKKQLPDVWPAYQLGSAISDVINQAEKVFYAEEK